MDFDFTEEQNALRDAVARWVGRDFPFERRHALARAGGPAAPSTRNWPRSASRGWPCPRPRAAWCCAAALD